WHGDPSPSLPAHNLKPLRVIRVLFNSPPREPVECARVRAPSCHADFRRRSVWRDLEGRAAVRPPAPGSFPARNRRASVKLAPHLTRCGSRDLFLPYAATRAIRNLSTAALSWGSWFWAASTRNANK